MGVTANSRSIVHSGDGSVNTAAPPDACKTPSPGGPVPIPYVNIANDSDLAKGSKKVKIEGNPIGLESSNLSTSSGDEPGTAGGGIVSSKFKGKLTWGTSSSDVKAEGKGVTRFMDVAQHNGNSFNTVFQEMGGTGLAYGDDFPGNCRICEKGPDDHRVIETTEWQERAFQLRDKLSELENARAPTATPKPSAAQQALRPGLNVGRGYMVGTMLCLGGGARRFATMSNSTNAGFEDAATRMGYTPIPGGPATPDEMMSANPMFNPNRPGGVARRAAFQARWQQMAERAGIPGQTAHQDGYNTPGTCAAAKLLARSGHKPLTITEFFWARPGKSWSASYTVFSRNTTPPHVATWRALLLQQRHDVTEAQQRPYTSGRESVASCHTCQRILFMLLCTKNDRKCC